MKKLISIVSLGLALTLTLMGFQTAYGADDEERRHRLW